MEKVEGQGTDFTLNNTTDNKFVVFEGSGNTEQEQLTGKNLYNKNATPISRLGATETVIDTGIKVTVTETGNTNATVRYLIGDLAGFEGKTLTLSSNAKSSSTNPACMYLRIVDSQGNTSSDFPPILSPTTTDGTITAQIQIPATLDETYHYLVVLLYGTREHTASIGDYVNFNNLQLEEGSTATSYEPYCGGIPAPNPNYEIPVKNVTGDVVNKIQNKNLFDKNNAINAYLNADGTTTANSAYRVSDYIDISNISNLTISGNYGGSEYCCFYDTNKTFVSNFGMSTLTTKTVSVPTNAKYIRVTVRASVLNNYQLEQGLTATDFVEHQEQNLPLTLGDIELCKIDTAEDYFIKEDGRWYLNKEVGKQILNGSESGWALNETNTNTMRFVLNNIISDKKAFWYTKTYMKNNYYQQYSGNAEIGNVDVEGIAIRDDLSGFTIRALISRVTNLDGFKAWLSTHNTKIYYRLKTPTKTEITDTTLIAQLEAFAKAMSYDEQTNISSRSNELGMIIDAEAVTKAYDDTEMIENIEEIKEEQITQNTKIEALQAENTELKKDIANMSKAMLTTKGQGTDFTLNNTTDNKFVEFEGSGNTEQEQYSGKNLWKMPTSETKNGLTFILHEDGTFDLTGTATEQTTFRPTEADYIDFTKGEYYTLSTNITGIAFLVALYQNNTWKSTPINRTSSQSTTEITVNPTTTDEYNQTRCLITIPSETTVNIKNGYVQLEKGETATAFEKYISASGIPAPNPSYEIPVKKVTGDVVNKIQNKNLAVSEFQDKFTVSGQGDVRTLVNSNYKKCQIIKVKPSTQYTIHGDFSGFNDGWGRILQFEEEPKVGSLSIKANAGHSPVTITTLPNTNYILIFNLSDADTIIPNLQLEQGSTATSYVEHKEQNLPLTLGDIELCKIDTAKDYFFKNVVGSKYYNAELLENRWYLHKETEKVVLNGSENWTIVWNETNRYGYKTDLINALYPTNTENFLEVFSNYYKAYIQNTLWNRDITHPNFVKYGMCIRANNSQVIIKNNDLTTLSDFTSWLSTHNLILYYQLATPTNTKVTDTTLEAQLENLYYKSMSYDEQTNISSTSNELGMIIDAEAIQNINNVLSTINSRLDLVEG